MTRPTPARKWPVHSELAGAETVGAVILLAVVVTAIGVVSVGVLDPDAVDVETPPLEVVAESRIGSDTIVLTRMAGAAVQLGDLAILVDIDDVRVMDIPAGEVGHTWITGESLTIGPLPEAISAGQRVQVTVVARTGAVGSILATSAVPTGVPASEEAPPGPAIWATEGADPIAVRSTQNFLLQATADHVGGRKMVFSVMARVVGLGGLTRLHDDGTAGDAVAGDGQFVATFMVPVGSLPGLYPIVMSAIDLEGREATAVAWVRVLEDPPPPGQLGLAGPGSQSGSGGGTSGDGSTDGSSTGDGSSAPSLSTPTSGTSTTSSTSGTPAAVVDPSFAIIPTSGIASLCAQPLRIEVIGSQITYGAGGPAIPVTANLTQNGGSTFTRLFGGAPVRAGDGLTYYMQAGALIGIRGAADHSSFHARYDSFANDPHVQVLKAGDAVPNVQAYSNQSTIAAFLAPYVANGLIQLAPNQVIMLYEFSPNLASPAADFQDLVILMAFPLAGCQAPPPTTSAASSRGWIAVPQGGHYTVNLVAANVSAGSNVTGSHVIFIPLFGGCRMELRPGPFGVSDRSCSDNDVAIFSLPAAGAGGADHYRIFMRALGPPGGMVNWTQCFEERHDNWCSTGSVTIGRTGGNPVTTDVTSSLLGTCNDPDNDGVFSASTLFSPESEGRYWEINGNGQRAVQMRIYPVPTPPVPRVCHL